MMRFVIGVAVGAAAYWAYKQGMLPSGAQDLFESMTPGAPTSEATSQIIRPTPHEISSRPTEPIPS